MFRKICQLSLVFPALCLAAGCVVDGSESGVNATVETQTVTYIDRDSSQDKALGLLFGMQAIDDRLDFNAGDRIDWRYIIVPDDGTISIKINLDSPKNIDGGYTLVDASNNFNVADGSFSKGQSYYEAVKDFPVQRGKVYFFKTYATAGKSVYTIAPTFVSAPKQIAVTMPEPAAQPDPTPARKPERESKSSTRPRSSRDSDTSSAKSEKKPAAVEEPSGKTVTGTIALLTMKDDGSAEITINGLGEKQGVHAGDIGKISGNGKVEMLQCFPTRCRALVPASMNPKSIPKGAKVSVNVK